MATNQTEANDEGAASSQSAVPITAVSKLIKLLASNQQLIKLLANDQPFTSTEIAETLWLAMKIEPVGEVTPLASPTPAKPKSPPPIGTARGDTQKRDPALDAGGSTSRATVATAIPQAGVLPTKALPVWLSDPSMLSDPLSVMRALKPLLRKVNAGVGRRLDESETVDKIARTGLWLPVLAAESEPWFDLILVVDGGSSMHLWQRLVDDLVRIFQQYGAFRNLQVFEMVVTAEANTAHQKDTVRLRTHAKRRGHRPSELIDPRGRRIAIVLSDCAGAYWWNGQLLPMLQAWADVMPTVVWQMLPEWMWARTALGRGKGVSLSNGTPGAANQQLQPLSVGLDELSDSELKRVSVPVVTSDPSDLNNWSLMLMGDRRERTPGFLLPQMGGRVPKSQPLEEMAQERMRRAGIPLNDEALQQEIERIAIERIQRFLQLSSPPARRLVMLLAAAPVITLPVMRLIRDSMMSDERSPLPVAEVFLSGLLQRLPKQKIPDSVAESGNAPSSDNNSNNALDNDLDDDFDDDLVQYDFVPNVRDLLRNLLPAVDTIDVVNSVSAAVEERWNAFSTQDFRAFLLNPQEKDPDGLEGMRSFASITADILQPLGGHYAEFADELRRGAAGKPEPERKNIDDDFFIPDLRILDFFRAQVREETPPLQLVIDEFTVATLEIEQALPEDLDAALREIVAMEDESLRVAALIELAPQLPGATFSLLVRVVKVVQEILSDRNRLHIFSILLPYLPDRLRSQMQAAISELEGRFGLALVEFEFEVATVVPREHGQIARLSRQIRRQGEWEVRRDRQTAYQFIELLNENTLLEMVAIPAGKFTMGSPESEPQRYDDESPQHEVSVAAFFMGQYPVTQAQWRFVAALEQVNRALAPDPSNFKGDDRPVEQVSWEEAVEFCDRLSQLTSNDYRLPSEAQWEYACRAGTITPFHFGGTILPELANYNCTEVYSGGTKGEFRQETTPVDEFGIANTFGLCDMHGNVWEWCADHWHDNYEGAPRDGSAWLKDDQTARRVRRGGSWFTDPWYCRSATRVNYAPVFRNSTVGFRVSCAAPRTLQPPTD